MLTCTHKECGHTWLQMLLPEKTAVDSCVVCDQEREEAEAANLSQIRYEEHIESKWRERDERQL